MFHDVWKFMGLVYVVYQQKWLGYHEVPYKPEQMFYVGRAIKEMVLGSAHVYQGGRDA